MPKQDPRKQALQDFVEWWRQYCKGREKSEAQIFLDHLFQAVGHKDGVLSIAELEYYVRHDDHTSFADLVWKPTVLIEMKSRGEYLENHYDQAFHYWMKLVPNRPRFVILCNFDELWIYDFDNQLDEPLDKVLIEELPERFNPIGFLFKQRQPPLIFNNNLVQVTENAAKKVARIFRSLESRGIEPPIAQRFILQCVVSMFAEDIDLLPNKVFTHQVIQCQEEQASSSDRLGQLFWHMNQQNPAPVGPYEGVGYFDGGLFQEVYPLDLESEELDMLFDACMEDWSKVKPPIFGSLFETSTDPEERHKHGMHFTSEADIQKVVSPTISEPLYEIIESADSSDELREVLKFLREFTVLDPACGSGNFLYIAYRELRRLENTALHKILQMTDGNTNDIDIKQRHVTAQQFHGIDVSPFGVELAKVTLMIARKLAIDELDFDEEPLPLDNLDENIVCQDALFTDWPAAHAIIGNPPYQSKNKMIEEFGAEYVNRIQEMYPEVSGRADYCVYWFKKAHDNLSNGNRAGLVGTNTIRQTYSRESGLDYIVENDGTIFHAVSSEPWSGESNVFVSIVNWIKGEYNGVKRLFEDRDGHLIYHETDHIPSTLSHQWDVSKAEDISANENPKVCFQGQTPGHDGFTLDINYASNLLEEKPSYQDVIFPYLTGHDLLNKQRRSQRSIVRKCVIDFDNLDLVDARLYEAPYEIIESKVLPDRKARAEKQAQENKRLKRENPSAKLRYDHIRAFDNWWKLFRARNELIERLNEISKYIVCSRVTKRPIFEFVSSRIHPSDALQAFTFDDYYSFGILQSGVHWAWFTARCSTLKGDYRYTSNTVFRSFPWPQDPSIQNVDKVVEAAKRLLEYRNSPSRRSQSLRKLYQNLEIPGKNNLKELHSSLDEAVLNAYGFGADCDILRELLELNQMIAAKEADGESVTHPGLPEFVENQEQYTSEYCVEP